MVIRLRSILIGLSPVAKRMIIVAMDMALIPLALWLALSLRYGEWFGRLNEIALIFAALTIFSIPVFVRLGLYRAVMRYVGWQAFEQIALGVLISSAILLGMLLLIPVKLPRSTFILYGLVALPLIGGSRWLIRRALTGSWMDRAGTPVAIYGAGISGRQLASILRAGREYRPVAFLDDNRLFHYRHIKGIEVLDPWSDDVVDQLQSRGVKDIFLSIPSATPALRRRILSHLETFPMHVRTVPGMQEILSGDARLEQVREIQLEDLLGREPVPPIEDLLGHCIKGKVVLVTGAAGSIGSELCRQIITQGARTLLLLDHSEFGLYAIESELRRRIERDGSDLELVALLGSVSDPVRLNAIFSAYPIDTVYHAAAYKHVPLVEQNPLEGLRTNTVGTWYTAECAKRHGVKHFVLISTDKAVRPTNAMGASKRMAEMVLQAMQNEEGANTVFSMVRFGNVLGSSGSVVPLFREQIRQGGPVTVTHPEVTRYFMTIPEAVQLVIQAGAMARGGDVFVLDMGEPVKIVDLARHMIRLSGFEVRESQEQEGIEITFTGLRPGEKLYEELLIGNEVLGTEHPKIMRAMEEKLPMSQLLARLDSISAAIASGDVPKACDTIQKTVGGYTQKDGIQDFVWIRAKGAAADVPELGASRTIVH